MVERLNVAPESIAVWAGRTQSRPFAKFGAICRYRLSNVIAWEGA